MVSREMNMLSLGCILRGRENINIKQKRGDAKSQLRNARGKKEQKIPTWHEHFIGFKSAPLVIKATCDCHISQFIYQLSLHLRYS